MYGTDLNICKERIGPLLKLCAFMLGFFVFTNGHAFAQLTEDQEEVSVFLNVQRVGAAEIPAVIRNDKVWLPVAELFNFLKIRYELSKSRDSVSGTFISPASKYLIDRKNQVILYGDQRYELKPGELLKTSSGLYLQSDLFAKLFGLNCVFSFRNLSVVLSTDLELPVIREMRQEQMRNNLNRLSGIFKADTVIGRNYPLFYFGTADYSALTSAGNKGTPQDARLSLGLGGMVAGGETNVVLNYHNNQGFSGRQQYYLWRYVDNDMRYAKQFLAGKIQGQSISSIYSPVIGVQVTNAPTTYRRSFGTYTLNNKTEPNWMVELYVNGVLINYVKADASGFFTFNVPLVYGNTVVKLRYYGPYGEERSTEQNISIPFNFLPEKEFEYTASSGILEEAGHAKFARLSTNYGLSRSITVGGGIEYLSSVTSGSKIPFVNTSVRLLSNLLFSAEYDHDVRSRAILSYNLPSGLQIELNNTWYKKGQTAINNTFLEDRKLALSFPMRGRHFSAYTQLSVQQILLENTRYTLANWMLSAAVGSINASAATYSVFLKGADAYVYTNYSLSLRAFRNLLITQQVQYEYTGNKVIGVRTELEKRVFRNGYLNLSYEKNFASDITNIELGVRYDFSFAQTRVSVRKSNDLIRSLQGISGSLIHDGKSGFTNFNNYTSVGKGAVLLIPYLDMNGNGRRDKDEPKAEGLKLRINGGRIKQSVKDTTIQITDLEAYTNYNIELDGSGFDRLAWKFPKANYTVVIDPNYVKNVEVPISVFGEASGRVTLKDGAEETGQGNVILNFYNEHAKKVGQTVSEADGYFSYLGLLPGKYKVEMDPAQLRLMDLKGETPAIPFVIVRTIEGDLVNHLDMLTSPALPSKADSAAVPAVKVLPVQPEEPVDAVETPESYPIGSLTVQAAHFKFPMARNSQRILLKYYKNVVIVPTKWVYYDIQIRGVRDLEEANEIIKKIKLIGFPDAYVLKPAIPAKPSPRVAPVPAPPVVIPAPVPPVQPVGPPSPGSITVQAAHFKLPMAKVCQAILSRYYQNVVIVPTKWVYYNIQIRDVKDRKEAKAIIKRIRPLGFPKAYVLKSVSPE